MNPAFTCFLRKDGQKQLLELVCAVVGLCAFSWGGGSLWLYSTPEGQNAEGAQLIINVRMAGLQKTQPKIKEMRLIHPPVFIEVPPCMGDKFWVRFQLHY